MIRFFELIFWPLVVLLLWLFFAQSGWINPYLLPSPLEVLSKGWDLLNSGVLIKHLSSSMARVFSGFLIAATLGMIISLLVWRSASFARQSQLILEIIRVVPPLSLIPLLILWLGIGEAPKITIVVLASFFPIYLSSLQALKQMNPKWMEMALSFGLSKKDCLRYVWIPNALPGIFTGLRLGFGYSWRALVGAELIAASSGLGYLIEDASSMAQTSSVFVGIACIAFFGVLCDLIFQKLLNHFAPWIKRGEAHR